MDRVAAGPRASRASGLFAAPWTRSSRWGPFPGEVLRIVVGHLVNSFLLDRAALAILQDVYPFIRKAMGTWCPLTDKVRNELRTCVGVMMLIAHDAARPLSNCVYCSDASMKGYALHACTCSREEAHEIGRWRERWRFREVREERADPEAGELNGMGAGLESLAPHFDEWIQRQTEVRWPSSCRVPVAVPQLRRLEEVPEALPAFPDSLLQPGRWRRVVVGACSSPAPIHIQEAKISLLGLRRESRSTDSHGTQLVSLGDNLERGRCCRRSAAAPRTMD